jgi:hypothetical protein
MSADVDITAAIRAPHDGFVAAMQVAGFDLRVEDWRGFLARTRVFPFVYRASELPVDIVLAGPGLEEEFLARVVLVTIEGITVPVIGPEDLIVTKVLAGRPKDLEDVRTILGERRGRLDLDRARRLLGLLEGALSRRDLLPELDRALASVDPGTG